MNESMESSNHVKMLNLNMRVGPFATPLTLTITILQIFTIIIFSYHCSRVSKAFLKTDFSTLANHWFTAHIITLLKEFFFLHKHSLNFSDSPYTIVQHPSFL